MEEQAWGRSKRFLVFWALFLKTFYPNFSGVREAFETNAASRPWMQLDMGEEVTVKKVTFQLCSLD